EPELGLFFAIDFGPIADELGDLRVGGVDVEIGGPVLSAHRGERGQDNGQSQDTSHARDLRIGGSVLGWLTGVRLEMSDTNLKAKREPSQRRRPEFFTGADLMCDGDGSCGSGLA